MSTDTTPAPPTVPPGYKQTEVGVIPVDWEVLQLRTCLRGSPRYGINAAAVTFDDRLPAYLRITDISEDSQYVPSPPVSVQQENALAYLLAEGDLVFARTGASVGKSYLYNPNDGPLVFAGYLIAVTPDVTKLDPAFLSYYVQTQPYWDWVGMMSIRSGQPGINGQEYGSLHLPLPPPPEQRAIAAALADVDGLITALDRLIAKKRDIKQATMQQLLTGKTRLPGFGGEWETKRLGEVAHITMGQSPSSQFYNIQGNGLPLIQGNADIDNHRTIARIWTTQITRQCDYDDLILTVRAPVGALGLASEPSCLGRGVCGIRPTVNALFLFQVLRFAEHRWKLLEQGSTFTAANSRQVSQFLLVIPVEIEEQAAIAAVLSDMDAEIAALEQRRAKTQAIKQGMMQQLLTGRVRLTSKEVNI